MGSSQPSVPPIVSEWIERLVASQSAEGGLSAEIGLPPNSESTALGLLALRAHPEHADQADRARDWLLARQRPDGSWALFDDTDDGSWVTAWALLALQGEAAARPETLRRGADWLASREGRRLGFLSRLMFRLLPAEERTALDPQLVGWPWHGGSFSWVEPTSVALLALKRLRTQLGGAFPEDRVQEGELLLYDRECDEGGWNYGNSAVLGEQLHPYPDVTAIALLALRDQPAERNAKSLKILGEMLASDQTSGLTLALGSLCLSTYGSDVSGLRQRLVERYGKTAFMGEVRALAFASLAFAGGETLRV
jgi:hypothetical protein